MTMFLGAQGHYGGMHMFFLVSMQCLHYLQALDCEGYTTEILSPGKKYQRFHTKGKFISNSKPRTLDKNLQGKRFQTLKHEINPKKPTFHSLKATPF